jgi:Flp pilus assembly protein TadG
MFKEQKGQTLIETALILFILLLILLGISEFARAWYTKNSLKNAVRSGARVAVVTPSVSDLGALPCPQVANSIINVVCTSPGVKNDNRTSVSINVDPGSGPAVNGNEIMVTATYSDPNFYIVGNSPWPWPKSLSLTTYASMRYE